MDIDADKIYQVIKKRVDSASTAELAIAAIIGLGIFIGLFGGSKIQNAINTAKAEYAKWTFTETNVNAIPLLTKYWASVNLPLQPTSIAWSAAFISYIADNLLTSDQSHIGYARSAYRDRVNKVKGKYWAYKPSEISKVKKGDILIKRRSGSEASWNDVTSNTGFIPTHGDIVIEVTNAVAKTLGGNVSNSVSVTNYPLYGGKPGSDVFTILRVS